MSTHPNAALIQRFYTAFAAGDAETMASCYAPDVRFSDPAFPDLQGPRAAHMWRMLTARATDLEITFCDVRADDRAGSARWEARYTFGATGRHVVNHIDARFTFRDGLIAEHIDEFDFHRWAGQALGLTGRLLGWSGWLRRKVQAQANGGLEKYIDRQGLGR